MRTITFGDFSSTLSAGRIAPQVAPTGSVPTDQQVYKLALNTICKAYNCKPTQVLASKSRIHKEAKMFLFKLLRDHSSLTFRTIAKMTGGGSHGNVSDMVNNLEGYLSVGDKHLTEKYRMLSGALKEYISLAPALEMKKGSTKSVTRGQGGRFVKKTGGAGGSGNGNGGNDDTPDEPAEGPDEPVREASDEPLAEIPTLDSSPLNHQVIDRGQPDQPAAMQPTTDEQQQKQFLNVDDYGSYTPFEDEGDSDEDSEGSVENTIPNDVPPRQFSSESQAGPSESQGYNVPPEASEKTTKFSTSSILDMVEMMLPKLMSMATELDVYAVGDVMSDVSKKAANASMEQAKKLNREHEQGFINTVTEITPYIKEPLQHYLKFNNLEVPPWVALVTMTVWLGVMLYLNARDVSKRNKAFLQDLEEICVRHREEMKAAA